MTAMAGISTTCATGALVAGIVASSQAYAFDNDDYWWNGSDDGAHRGQTTVVTSEHNLIITGWNENTDAHKTETQGANNQRYGDTYQLGTITVEDGGQFWINITNMKVPSQTTSFKKLGGVITLKGHDFSDEFLDENGQPVEDLADVAKDDWRAKATVVFYDGSYNFEDQMNIDGYVYMYNDWGGSQQFTNLTSINTDDNSDVLVFQTNRTNTKAINYTLNFNRDKAKNSPNFKAFNGTIIVRNPYDDGLPNDNPRDFANLVITSSDVIGSGVTYRFEGFQTALHLNAQNLYIPNVEVGFAPDGVNGDPTLRSKTTGSQVRQTIGHLHMEGVGALLCSDGGSVAWTIGSLTNVGDVEDGETSSIDEILVLYNGTEGYKPNILYLNTPNKTITESDGTVTKKGFTGHVWLSDYFLNDVPTEEYGVFQDYIEIGHPDALAEATLSLIGDWQAYTFRGDDDVLSNDDDYSLENYPVLAINTTDVNIGALQGSYLGIIMSGTAPIDGTEANPSTAVAPVSSAATVTLHVGSIGEADDIHSYAGEILKNVNIDKQGLGRQVIYNLENDPARYITVTSGILELGSVGDFRRLSVASGGRAEVGLSVSSKINTWGKMQEFVYFEAFDNGIDLSDATKISGNVVLTDKLYNRDNREDAADDTITVLYLNPQRYSGNSVTLVDADLAVFDPVTGSAADLSKIKTITATESSSLVSASPDHHGIMFDPNIVVNSDIVMKGRLNFMAYGSLIPSQYADGDFTFQAYNTTYTGTITSEPYMTTDFYGESQEVTTSSIYKNGFGKVTLAGDMSEYRGMLIVYDGTMALSGTHGAEKNFSTVMLRGEAKAHMEIVDGAHVSTTAFLDTSYKMTARVHCETSLHIGKGATLSINGENAKLNDDANDKPGAWEAATFLVGSGSHMDVQIDGTLNMTRASYISVTDAKTQKGEVTRKDIHVNNGGVFNAKGIWLQSYSSSPDITTTVHVHSGGTLNLGSEGIGHADVSGAGAVKAVTDNHLIINFEDGAKLGILNDTESWSTQRAMLFDGLVTVNTQGFVAEEGSTVNGSAKMITLGSVQTVKDGAGVVKVGSGTLALGGGSNVDQAIVKDGYLSVSKIGNKYAATIGDVKTEDNGSLLFDLTDAIAVNQTSAMGQAHMVITGEVDGILNVTVRQGEEDYNGNPVEMNGKTFGIIASAPPAASNVNLIAMVDDGWTAEYFVNSNTGWGYVTINNTGSTLGNDALLTWASTDGESNFWGNSTEKNFLEDASSTDTRRFTNNSAVSFSQPGETVTILDSVYVTDKTIDGTDHAAMTVASSGYEFTGTGNIVGVGGTLKVEDGVHVTFSNTGGVYFENGVTLGKGATLRLEYLNDTSSNWDALVTGEGALEIATGGIRANVLSSVMGDKVTTVSLDNNTTIELTSDNPGEAAKLAAADTVVVKKGSRLLLNTRTNSTLLEEGDTLYLAGKGVPSEKEFDFSTEAAITVGSFTHANVAADVSLMDDTTLYLQGGSSLTFGGEFASNGRTLTLAGETTAFEGNFGTLILESADSSLMAGDIKMGVGSKLGFNLDDTTQKITNDISMNGSTLIARKDVTLAGDIAVKGASRIEVDDSMSMTLDSTISGSDDASITLVSMFGSATPGVVELTADNTSYDGSWIVMPGHVLVANNANALKSATVVGTDEVTTELKLGDAADYYYADGLNKKLDINSADGTAKTLELSGNDVYDNTGKIGKNVSLVMNGNGSQTFSAENSFATDYSGCLTVKDGMLAFRNAPTSYDTIELAGDESTLGIGYYDYTTPGKYGTYVANDLGVTNGQTLLVTQTGAMINGNLAPTSGGQITLGTVDKTWAAKGGLNMYGQALKLNSSDLAALTVNLSPFLQEGDYVELFTHVGEFNVDGKIMTIDDELGFLEDYFVCDDINLARAQLELTASGTLRIKLINDSDGIYYEYQGGGEWNNDGANKIWSTKDEQDAAYSYVSGAAAYFTNDQNETVSVTDAIVAREMAVKNGSYIFDLTEGNDLTITDRYYEMEGGVATFQLNAAETTDAAGNPVSDGAELIVDAGMGDISNTVVRGDGNTANRLILGGTTSLSDNARFEDVDLFMDGENSQLNLGDTTETEIQALGGEGSIAADGGELTISNVKDGVFVGSLVAADPDNMTPGANTLTIEAGDASKKQMFSNVTMDESWNLVNNGVLDLKPTDDSKLNSLTLGGNSTTILTVNTDKEQLMGLTELSVEDGAKVTLNSTGNAPIMSAPGTPGTSHTVLGSFADDGSLYLGSMDSLEIEIGTGSAFLMVDKTKPITLDAVYNDSTGHYDLVLKATVDDTNQFAPLVEGETNASAGADMLWSPESMEHMAAEPDGDLAQAFNAVANMATSANVDKDAIAQALAAVAGSSTAVLGSAFSADVERQLKAIRNRTTTMGVNQCEVNENMPYYNAWINAEGNHRELDADGLAAGYTHDSWGGTVGFDVDVTPSLTMGLALTAMYGDIESDGADKAEGDFDTMYLSAFARYARNAWVHTFVATVGRADVTLDRTVNVGGYSYNTTGETDGVAFGFMYEVGRVFALNEEGTTCWQPVFNVALRNSSISGYEEDGSDAALAVGDQDFTTVTFGVGARMQTIIGENLYNRTSIFEARALLKFDVGDTEAEATTAMINGNGKEYAIEGAEVGEIGVEIGAGVTIPVGAEGGSIFMDASADIRSGYTNFNGTVGYRVNF